MSPSNAGFTLCATYEEAAAAASELSRLSTVILDCEGRDIGVPGGALSIIALGDSTASRIFLFDVVALPDAQNPLLEPLLSLLRSDDITKLVWDGRCDFTEIADTYGVQLGGVLDLQLVEIAERPNNARRKPFSLRAEHTRSLFNGNGMRELTQDPSALDGVHRLLGLEHCVKVFQLLSGLAPKDPYVVAQHKRDGSAIWMNRPLSTPLLRYSAHDIKLIARLYAFFSNSARSAAYLGDMSGLKAMSARYMLVYPTRELRALHMTLGMARFVPFEVLEEPLGGVRCSCARCSRVLSLRCFATTVEGGVEKRKTFCKLCVLLARKNREGKVPEWSPAVNE